MASGSAFAAAFLTAVLLAACVSERSRFSKQPAIDARDVEAPADAPAKGAMGGDVAGPASASIAIESSAATEASTPAVALVGSSLLDRLAGAWVRDAESPEDCMVFRGDRLVRAEGWAQSIYTVTVFESGVKLRAVPEGRVSELGVAIDDAGRLVLTRANSTESTWVQADSVPRLALVDGMPLGDLKPTPAQIAEVAAELALRSEREQALRMELVVRTRTDPDAAFDPEAGVALRVADDDDQDYLLSILQLHGWVDAKRFSEAARSDALRVLMQSGHVGLRMTALPALLDELARAAQLDARQPDQRAPAKSKATTSPKVLARWIDRTLCDAGEPQRFATQWIAAPDESLQLVPMIEPSRLFERRRDAGLPPFKAHVDSLQASGLNVDRSSIPTLALRESDGP